MRISPIVFGLLLAFTGTIPSASAQSQKPMNESQARAYCAKAAENNAAANRRQMWADACVQKVMARQKKS
jgi:hypothetical protein